MDLVLNAKCQEVERLTDEIHDAKQLNATQGILFTSEIEELRSQVTVLCEIKRQLFLKVSNLEAEVNRASGHHFCIICQERNASTVCLPCRHLVLCEDCAQRIEDCPMCRSEIEEILIVYPC